MKKPVISVDKLSKAFPVYGKPSDILLEAITRRKRHDDFWALRDVSFNVNEKQRLGIVGPNGSGKSTLLKILTGHLEPTFGAVEVKGKVSAMLSLNTVLNPEETGLSNIKFNLLLNGAPASSIEALTEEIIEFTELGQFIYAPVKTYSSGMNAKLAFAINTALDPGILIIDEVLSVGDAYFVGKATKRMIGLCEKGKALIFVSHSNAAVQMLCDTVLWLDNGSIRMHGPAESVLAAYEEDFRRQDDLANRDGNAARAAKFARLAVPGELGSDQIYKLRLRPLGGGATFQDTHYVRAVRINGQEVPLSITKTESNATTYRLDLIGSEWGRFYSKDGHDCRLLSARTGRNKGGQVFLPMSAGNTDASLHVAVEFETTSVRGREQLTVETLHYSTGQWKPAGALEASALADGWQKVKAQVEIPVISPDDFARAIALADRNSRADVEITGAAILVASNETMRLIERQPFTLRVKLRVNRPVESADVGIKINRADGVYVFWQSNGLVGVPITQPAHDFSVDFIFDANYLPSGEYLVSAYVANGWDFPKNYPYSEMYDRKIDILNFTVTNETAGLDFGAINQRISVRVLPKEM